MDQEHLPGMTPAPDVINVSLRWHWTGGWECIASMRRSGQATWETRHLERLTAGELLDALAGTLEYWLEL